MIPPTPAPPSRAAWPVRAALRLAVLRPQLLLPAWAAAATGAALVPPGTGAAPARNVATALIAWSCALAAVHLLNLVTDRRSDRWNAKNLFWMGRVSEAGLRRVAAVAAAAALLGAFALVLAPGRDRDAGEGGPVLLVVVATLLLGGVYSLPPLRLSARWGWDLAANACGYGGLAPWLGAALAAGAPPPAAFLGVEAVLVPLVGAAFLWTTLLDREGDARDGKHTWAVRWGLRATRRAAALLAGVALAGALAGLSGLSPGDAPRAARVALAASALGVLLLALVLLRPTAGRGAQQRAVPAAVLLTALPGLVIRPWLALPLLGWLILSYSALHLARPRP
jgi:1,4-dihydroxy-2-naphthoate octaprenyltransferase